MSTVLASGADLAVRDAVLRQLEWDPAVDASAIGVSAIDGAVTLTGAIDTYAGKLSAERATKRVRGVRAVANDIDVRLVSGRTDADIAADVVKMLRLHSEIPDAVQATVRHAQVSLSGHVPWLFQRRAAARAVRHVRGVAGVRNGIAIALRPVAPDLQKQIEDALRRSSAIDARHITVSVEDEHVTLAGTVESWPQREVAEHVAADAAGVAYVHNRIVVEPLEPPFEGQQDNVC